ncbi:elements of external origin [Teredinibacter sp. KSP-S5-2]|uniref:elements of external origin n=1 Tax=Teredinibacter sp. KSP-S5-2 TaxID=3034506 RepID=UPI00293418BB|nr:elements of external origin [Teredinibacter sp. KSP-S5-2]WNO10405.1 elements of external origin [Teredinibacter sp. KSP-S5-2]
MTELLSNRQFAKLRGVSETAVRKAIKTGRITTEANGKIDPDKANREWEQNTNSAKRREQLNALARKDSPSGNTQVTNRQFESQFQKARTANEVLKAQIGRIELQVLKGELIDRDKALRTIFKIARTERDAWLNWPARIAAQVAAELDIDEQQFYVALEEQVRKQLATLVI